MKKQFKTAVYAVVLLGALIAAYYVARMINTAAVPEDGPPAAEDIVNLRLLERTKEDLVSVTIRSGDNEMVFLPEIDERYNRVEWYMEGFTNLSMDKSTMDSMVTPIYYFSPIEMLDPTDDNLAEYGLDVPAASVTGLYNDGSYERVSVGKLTPNGEYYYAKLEGTPGVYLLYSITGDRFFNTAYDLIKKDVPGVYLDSLVYVYFMQKDVYELELGYTGSDDEMQKELESYGMVTLNMLKPYPGRDLYYGNLTTNLLDFVEPLAFTKVVAAFPEDLSVYGLDDPVFEIRLIDGDEDEYNLIVGSDADESYAYAMLPGREVVYTISKSLLEPMLDINILRMVDKFVALINIKNCEEIRITSTEHGREHVITINHDVIKAEDEDGSDEEIILPEIDGQLVEELPFKTYYQSLIGLAYDVEIYDFELTEEPVFVVRYILNDGKPDVLTRYYPYNNDFYAVRKDENPAQFVVNKRSVNIMFDTLDRLLRGEIIR